MSTTDIGRLAENAAANYLISRGFRILARNWRTRFHEVDIVASKAHVIHFVEVKFRQTEKYGSGLEHISADKIQRLERAALNWSQLHHSSDSYQIDAISISGTKPYYLHYEPNITGE